MLTPADQITYLLGKNSDLDARLERAEAERDKLAARLAQVEADLVNTQDGYRNKLSELRGRIAGALTGRMSRMLQTALDAARGEPPRTAVIIERIEDVTAMIAAFVAAEQNPTES